MPDANLLWGGDLSLSPTGDIALAEDAELGQQRVLRRLLTNAKDYTWQPGYGAGCGQFVGATADQRAIEGAIRSQIAAETSVSPVPDPQITVDVVAQNSVCVTIAYTDTASATTQALTFSMDS